MKISKGWPWAYDFIEGIKKTVRNTTANLDKMKRRGDPFPLAVTYVEALKWPLMKFANWQLKNQIPWAEKDRVSNALLMALNAKESETWDELQLRADAINSIIENEGKK